MTHHFLFKKKICGKNSYRSKGVSTNISFYWYLEDFGIPVVNLLIADHWLFFMQICKMLDFIFWENEAVTQTAQGSKNKKKKKEKDNNWVPTPI